MGNSRPSLLPVPAVLFLLIGFAGASGAESPVEAVELKSGAVRPGRPVDSATHGLGVAAQRFVVRLAKEAGSADRSEIEALGVKVDAPLSASAYLISASAEKAAQLNGLARVDWVAPYLPQDKIAPAIASIAPRGPGDEEAHVAVVLHLFSDTDVRSLKADLEASGYSVAATRGGARFGRAVLLMTKAEIADRRETLARRNEVFWIDERRPRRLANDDSIWVSQSGLDGGMMTPIFDHGLYGEGQIAAVLDTGIDVDMCYFRDDVNGPPPTNTAGGTSVDPSQRKVIAVDFLDPAEDPLDVTDWDTQGHGTTVASILAADDLANPVDHDHGDGMAPAAKLVIQDAGYAADNCGDLPGIGCPVTDLHPIFQQAYDQGARVHNNSWNDNENAAVQNNYSDASQDVDEFMWNNKEFLIVFACGNHALGGEGTIGSPSTAKNSLATGATYGGDIAWATSDITAWGPTDDGRIKPDVMFPGQSITAADGDGDITTDNCGTRGWTGTSMAAPGVSGMALLTREYFMKGYYPAGAAVPGNAFEPSAALVKAMLINSAVSLETDYTGSNPIQIPSIHQGWGRITLDNALHFDGQPRKLWVDDHSAGFTGPGDAPVIYMLEVHPSQPLEVTLAWTDFPSTPAASTHLVNDLDLRVDAPGGGFRGNDFFGGESSTMGGTEDRLNNVENVFVSDPEPGVYAIRVAPHAVPSGPQPWALVVTGDFTLTSGPRPGYFDHVIDDSSGNGDGILDPGESALVPVELFNSGDADAQSVSAKMHSPFPDLLKVYGNPVSYGDIAAGQQKSSGGPHYEVTLEPSATCGQILGLNLALAGAGIDQASGFQVPIGVDQVTYQSTDVPKTIPASGSVWSSNPVASDHPYTEIDAEIHIDHQDISEFRVLFYSPINTGLNLHVNSSPGVSGLHTIYDDETEPAGPGEMADFLDLGPSGNWRIRVIDTISGAPAGEIESWALHFKNDVPFHCNPVGCGEPVPPPVGDTLTATRVGASDVRIDWNGVGGASDYNVWRAADKQLLTAEHVGETGGTTTTDTGAQSLPGVNYYVVRSVNSCRWESN
ncbi:MAG: S8 family serine peptidase [bacterium]|nr:S8 family serine peptidase [bacterium]